MKDCTTCKWGVWETMLEAAFRDNPEARRRLEEEPWLYDDKHWIAEVFGEEGASIERERDDLIRKFNCEVCWRACDKGKGHTKWKGRD